MPWWNQLKRKELAEKKEKEDDEKRREEERLEEEKKQELERQEEKEESKPVHSVNKNELTGDLEESAISNSNLEEQSKCDTEEKVLNKKEVKQNKSVQDSRVTKVLNSKEMGQKGSFQESRVISTEGNVQFNSNQNDDNGNISSNLIIKDDALAKKIYDLEIRDSSNIKIVSS